MALISNQEKQERVIIAGVETPQNYRTFNASFKELSHLAEVAGGMVVEAITQSREKIDSKTILGKGKIEELQQLIELNDATTVIFNERLTPRQLIILEKTLETKVLDRMQLILDIFSLRAKSREGQLQVELAQLKYLMPRLIGSNSGLSRQAGGIGSRGPGEKKLETDRRNLQSRMLQINNELKIVERKRALNRAERLDSAIYKIGLVGYTNAGKSTIFEQLTNTTTLVQNQLFATLDPLSKKMKFENGFEAILTDTVGFIQDLPTELIDAFKSTLEESKYSDLLLHIVDISDPDYQLHEAIVLTILKELKMSDIPLITIYNKKDLNPSFNESTFNSLVISSKLPSDISKIQQKILELIAQDFSSFSIKLPISENYRVFELKKELIVVSETYDEAHQQIVLNGFVNQSKAWLIAEFQTYSG
ncbi:MULTISPECIES: GTPase HflX [unclassified Enterococcus]|uniref:GTPase HflX n=1 Tax=unclassified Enterococcus TaxID=2608891 RepID=UPI0015553B1C|nr:MULTISPECIES: GTPase HflX [unclassified Enterococcus]MBS7577539.1 GTPase HflX [Enterococcus sp. MMGLQ5-2]MBS7584962.1 GTPase HflX [Enterococcus sp. MMGLQ5-1]NPD12817.1 GTPase HflX [Enterococcus sp. MMGLQ5-1]NPD37372.1 GTPase HflX [Enterococcus sp. MMGLQ5-2]